MANPFKVGDQVVHMKATHNVLLNIVRNVAEVDGNFIRVMGSASFYPHTEFKAFKRPEEVIVIVTDGVDSKAYLKVNGKKVKEVFLKRNKADKHDLKDLTAYAVQKLLPQDGRELVARPAGYCGAVAVVGPVGGNIKCCYKPGLIMEFYGGKWKNADVLSRLHGEYFSSFPELLKFCQGLGFDIVELHRETT